MDWLYPIYIVSLYPAAALCLALALILWQRRFSPGIAPAALFLATIAEWALGCALELGSPTLGVKILWLKFQFLGIAILPSAWLIFAIQYTGRERWLSARRSALLAAEPLLVIALVWTNESHGLAWSEVSLSSSGQLSGLEIGFGPGGWFHCIYTYALLFLGAALLARSSLTTPSGYRNQVLVMLASVLFPWLVHLLYLSGLGPAPHLDLTPLALGASGAVLALTLRRLWLFDLVPIARSMMLSRMSDCALVLDRSDRIVDLNPAACKLLARPAIALIGLPAANVIPAVATLTQAPDGILAAHSGSLTEQRLEIPWGEGKSRRFYALHVSSLTSLDSIRTGRLVILRDITERKQAEEALRERENRLHMVASKMPAILWTTDASLRITSILGAGLAAFKMDAEDMIGKTIGELLSEDDPTGKTQAAHRRVLSGEPTVVETIISGHTFQCYIEPSSEPTGQVIGTAGIALDISKGKWAEAALRASEERYRQSVDKSPNPIFSIDLEGMIRSWNPACGQVFQYGPEMIGQHYSLLMHDAGEIPHLDEAIERVFRTKTPINDLDTSIRCKDGSVRFMASRLYPVLDQDGKVETCVFANTDISERKLAEEALRRQVEELLAITRISREINSVLDRKRVFDTIVSNAAALSGSQASAVFTLEAGGRFHLVAAFGLADSFTQAANSHGLPGEGTLLERAACERRPVQVTHIMDEPKGLLYTLAEEAGLRALLALPLIRADEVLGAILIGDQQERIYTQRQTLFLEALAQQSVNAIQNARLFEETRRRAVQQQTVNAAIAAAVSAPDLHNLLETALNLCLGAMGLTCGAIWVGPQAVIRGIPEENLRKDSPRIHAGTSELQKTVAIEDWRQVGEADPYSAMRSEMLQLGLQATLTVPLMAQGHKVGGMSLADTRPRGWLEEEVGMVEAIGQQLGSAVERLNLLAKTQEQALQVQQIMDTVPEGVLLLDASRKIVLANPAAWRYLDELAGSLDVNAPLPALGGLPVEYLLQMDTERPWHELETRSLPRRIFEAAARPLENPSGNEGWVIILREVTRERDAQARIQMQERLATVGQLAAGIAHDFNNIMAAVVVYTDLLTLEPSVSDAGRERISVIQQQVGRATSLIRQILDFSRRSVIEQSSLDLLPFIKELDKLLGRVLPENLSLDLTFQPGVYMINADPTRLQQVFLNLALNARDVMPEGGKLHFELGRLHLKLENNIHYPDLTPGDWITVRVSDSGPGISAEVLPHIFEPFFTTKPVGQGTGLGLAQVYGIVKQHGGSIDVHSTPGEGATFILYFPALQVPEIEIASAARITEKLGAGETVLVVEDDWAARQAIQALLETQNYRALTAANGVEALSIYERERDKIALVVSDIVMPEMGGLALYEILHEIQPEIKMLFVTGHPLDEKNQRLLEAGQVHWLQKPFTVQEFKRVLTGLLKESVSPVHR